MLAAPRGLNEISLEARAAVNVLKNETLNSDQETRIFESLSKKDINNFSASKKYSNNSWTYVKFRFPIISWFSSNYESYTFAFIVAIFSLLLLGFPQTIPKNYSPSLSHELSKSLIRSWNPHILLENRCDYWQKLDELRACRVTLERNEGFSLPFQYSSFENEWNEHAQ